MPHAAIFAALADELNCKVDDLFVEDEAEAASFMAATADRLPSDELLDALEFALAAAREKKARTTSAVTG